MYRLATLLALLLALTAVGCGDSNDDDRASPAAVADAGGSDSEADTGPSTKADEKQDGSGKKEPSDTKEDADEEGDAKNSDDADAPDDPAEALREAPAKKRDKAIETIVESALLQFGLKTASVDVSDGGRKVTAAVTRATACRAVASQEANMLVAIQAGAPTVKSARFEVAGTGEELGYYVLGCKKPEIPSGDGRVVLDHSGVGGPYKSKPFEITSKRWALEWVNQGNSLAVILMPVDKKAEENYAKPVGSQKPESGRYEYKGGGTYQIQAYGQGGWRVRVREIG